MTRRYAKDTSVPISRSRDQIETLLRKAGGSRIATINDPHELVVGFLLADRAIRMRIPIAGDASDQVRRSLWRAAHLVVKAKVEATAAGIETTESAWLAHVVLPDGRTMGEWAAPALRLSHERGELPTDPLLPKAPAS